jgi:DNA-binding Lrp family transcriptional regulator
MFMEGYLLLECGSGKVWKVLEDVVKIDEIKMAHVVSGNFDVIAFAEFSGIEELSSLIQKVQTLSGVEKTQTAIAMTK